MAHNTAIVLMGVSGAGKSTIGVRLAQRLGRAFLEGDTFHPPPMSKRCDKACRSTTMTGCHG